jgi:hypothetical protein
MTSTFIYSGAQTIRDAKELSMAWVFGTTGTISRRQANIR